MNIVQAKEEIKNTLRAYTAKDRAGVYKIPSVHQRPVLMTGPPGIGKTAIMKQIAEEMGVGLVQYTLTHHTRQSAVGLPMLEKRVFAGKEYTVTEYTMSEIIASVYQCMEQTKVKEGILFLDEINCVSETLAPTMLQFLQQKTFGTHRLPDGWLIVAAGNPSRYNRSVREFDIVTLDRVKKIEVEEDYAVWKKYAVKEQVHRAVLAYLDVKNENFYKIQEDRQGSSFVTARGWEDLSRIIQIYEELDIPVTKEVVGEYLQHKETAGDFAGFYGLCRKYETDYHMQELLSGSSQEELRETANLLRAARFDEKLAVISLLVSALLGKVQGYQENRNYIRQLHQELLRLKMQAGKGENTVDFQSLLEAFLAGRKHSVKIMEEQGLFDSRRIILEQQVSQWLEEQMQKLKEQRIVKGTEGFSWIKNEFYKETLKLKQQTEEVKGALDRSIRLVKIACDKGQELALFLTQISENEEIMAFITRHGCDRYLREGEILMTSIQEEALKQEIQNLQKNG